MRVFFVSPALGRSQLEVGWVVENARCDVKNVKEREPEHHILVQRFSHKCGVCVHDVFEFRSGTPVRRDMKPSRMSRQFMVH